MKTSAFRIFTFFLLAFLFLALPAYALQVTMTDLGTLGGVSSLANAINASGQVIGNSTYSPDSSTTHAFLWTSSGGMTDLGTLPGRCCSYAAAINDSGQVVGDIRDHVAFLWTSAGGMKDLGTLGNNYSHSSAFAINNSGQVVGGSAGHAVLWTSAGGMKDLGTLPGGSQSYAFAINDSGQVVGESVDSTGNWRAFLWTSADGMTNIGTLPGGNQSSAFAINKSGQVLGNSNDSTGSWHAFLWTSTDGMTDLGTLPGGVSSYAAGINDSGQVVGESKDSTGNWHAFLWTSYGGMTDLGTLPGYVSSYAGAINASGQVVGHNIDSTGSTSAFFWTNADGLTDLGGIPSYASAINDSGQVVGESANHAVLWTLSPATVPGAPTGVTAMAGNAQATVSFKAPASNGGSPITSYVVTSNPGGKKATGPSSPIKVAGLTNGLTYIFTVTATNSVGKGAASLPSNRVKPTSVTFCISGSVKTAIGGAISGVTINLGGDASKTTSTDAYGNYKFTGLYNGSYTLTPNKTGYAFTPDSKTITVNGANKTGQNFAGAVMPTYSISGTVRTSQGSAISGVTITLTGAASKTTTTNTSGVYTFDRLYNGSYTLKPHKTGYTFTPANKTITISGANKTGQNFTGAVTYTISGSVKWWGNGAGIPGITITLSGGASKKVTTNSYGNYKFTGVNNGSYTVTPTTPNLFLGFTPPNRAVTVNGANKTGQNFAGIPLP